MKYVRKVYPVLALFLLFGSTLCMADARLSILDSGEPENIGEVQPRCNVAEGKRAICKTPGVYNFESTTLNPDGINRCYSYTCSRDCGRYTDGNKIYSMFMTPTVVVPMTVCNPPVAPVAKGKARL